MFDCNCKRVLEGKPMRFLLIQPQAMRLQAEHYFLLIPNAGDSLQTKDNMLSALHTALRKLYYYNLVKFMKIPFP